MKKLITKYKELVYIKGNKKGIPLKSLACQFHLVSPSHMRYNDTMTDTPRATRSMYHLSLPVAYQRLLVADRAYGNCPCPEHNRRVCWAQRSHAAAIRYDMLRVLGDNCTDRNARMRVASRYWEKRATNIWKRALQNSKRELDDPVWQALAAHQLQRARRVYTHGRVRAEMMLPTPVPKPEKPKPTRKRVIHPVTGRYVWVDIEPDSTD